MSTPSPSQGPPSSSGLEESLDSLVLSSPIVQAALRIATPFALLVGVYLLFAGHNNPGGGFAAGLVLGAVVAAKTVTGTTRPERSVEMIAAGLVVVAVVSMAPLVFGETFLDQKVVTVELPVLGKVKSGSALPFDIGVAAIVVGLVLAVLNGLGAGDLARPRPTETGAQ